MTDTGDLYQELLDAEAALQDALRARVDAVTTPATSPATKLQTLAELSAAVNHYSQLSRTFETAAGH